MLIFNNEVMNMKINWIEYENLKTGLKIERIDFFEDITLLVGISGAGKTQILKAIESSLNIAINKTARLQPCYANIGISIEKNVFEWIYKIENTNEEFISENDDNYCFTYEKLLCNGDQIFERTRENVSISGYSKIPTPKKDESLILQYAEDDKLKMLSYNINKMYSVETELAVRGVIGSDSFNRIKPKIKENIDHNVDFKVFSHLPTAIKLYIVKEYYNEIYIKIFEAIKELFIEIEDINIIEDSYREAYFVAITVYGKQILQDDISNGMLKSIYYIIELFTMSENSLVLIDEFENGLGVNCIDLLANIFLFERTDLQFIITSHHPKIINHISSNKWKIIDRDIHVIKNSDNKHYGIGNSLHDEYFNLINRWEFEGKIQ